MRHLSFSNAISVLALFVALGGTTYAAVKIKANSVGSKRVRDDSLSGQDIREAELGQVPSAGAPAVPRMRRTPPTRDSWTASTPPNCPAAD